MGNVLCISSTEISGLATPMEYVNAVRDGYRQQGEGASTSSRTTLQQKEPDGKITGYSAILPQSHALGGYIYASGFSDSDAWFVAPLFDSNTGKLLALIDGSSMNPLKTSAASAVGVDELSRDNAKNLSIFGSGPQAKAQLRAVTTVRDLESISVFSPTKDHRNTFAAEMSKYTDCEVIPVSSGAKALRNSDIIITATKSEKPVFSSDILPDGVHITAMGQYHPEKRELDGATIERALYVPDLRKRVINESGAFLMAIDEGYITEDHIHAELGEIVGGTRIGRRSSSDITIFDSGGTGIETVASAQLIYEKAKEKGLGTMIDFFPASSSLTGLD